MAGNRDMAALTEREREVLRFLFRGYDIKSIARELDLSVNVVNERLRDARRRLGVSSSREAARILAAQEGHNFLGDREFGLGAGALSGVSGSRSDRLTEDRRRPLSMPIAGAAMIMIVAALVIGTYAQRRPSPPQVGGPPRVVTTSPGRGAVIRPGPFLLSITYDQPMLDGSFSYTRSSPETAIECDFPATLARDGRTFTVRCTAHPGRHYETWLNRPPYMSFKGLNGIAAEPYPLTFRAAER
jgi:DNA-binding CsgD family transcriptional regulator